MLITFSLQILSNRLLLSIIGRQKNNFSGILKIRNNNNLSLMINCENVVDVTLLLINYLSSKVFWDSY